MRNLNDLVEDVIADLSVTEQMNAEHGIDDSEWVEVRRDDLRALLAAARQHADCHASWVSMPAGVLEGVRAGLAGSGGRA